MPKEFLQNVPDDLKVPVNDEKIDIVYQCPSCDDVFVNMETLNSHINLHEQKYNCDACKFSTISEDSFKRHITQDHSTTVKLEEYTCSMCDFTNSSIENLSEHFTCVHDIQEDTVVLNISVNSEKCISQHDMDSVESCSYCDFSTPRIELLKKHTKLNHLQECEAERKLKNIHVCNHCSFTSPYLKIVEKHIKNKHSVEEAGEIELPPDKTQQSCLYCCFETDSRVILKKHMKCKHLELLNASKPHICPHCSYRSRSKGTLATHVHRKHQANRQKIYECKIKQCTYIGHAKSDFNRHMVFSHGMHVSNSCLEPGCQFYANRKQSLREHLETTHGIHMQNEVLQFESDNDFQIWLKSIETDTCSRFIISKKDTRRIYYECNRSGSYEGRGIGKRKPKANGSCKIGGNCTAAIKYNKLRDNKIVAYAYLTHYGHDMTARHLRLSTNDRLYIQGKLLSGETFEKILGDLHNNLVTNASVNLQRLQLLTRRDLFNLKRGMKPDTSGRNNAMHIHNDGEKIKEDDAEHEQNTLRLQKNRIVSKLDAIKSTVEQLSAPQLNEVENLLNMFSIINGDLHYDSYATNEHTVESFEVEQEENCVFKNHDSFSMSKKHSVHLVDTVHHKAMQEEDEEEEMDDLLVWEVN